MSRYTELDSKDFDSSAHAKAVLNILDDFAQEKMLLQQTQKAVLNILEDANTEKIHLQELQRAVFNILEDLGIERDRLEVTKREVVHSEMLIRNSLRDKEILLKEIHHRVKNNLQVISSLLSLQARHLTDSGAKQIFAESQNRVQSIALVHEKLYQSANLSHINFDEYSSALLENLFYTYNAAARGVTRVIKVAGVQLPIDLAIPCGLIVNELVTNSLKYAFPAGRVGSIYINLTKQKSGTIELQVGDDGVGLPKNLDPQNSQSLGLDLVFTFAEQLDAKVMINRKGGSHFQFLFSGDTL